jgi:HAD superfamily hydrolase (TIGR01509 family)
MPHHANHAILWDMDGTIIDTKESHYKAWNTILKEQGFVLDRDVYDANFGRNTQAILPLMLGFDPEREFAQKLLRQKEALFREMAPRETQLIPGVGDWLRFARERRIPQAVASSGSLRNIQAMLENFNLLDYFDALVPGAQLPAKPEPEIFLKAARKLNTPAAGCLVIEDSLAGVKAGRRAGMSVIAVATSHPRWKLSFADLVLDDFRKPPQEILEVLGWSL